MARSTAYWKKRQNKQFGRFGAKSIKAFAEPGVGSIAKAAWSGVKYLRTLVNSETFKADTGVTSIGVSTTATVIHLTAIAQGDLPTQRTGNSILSKYLAIRLSIAAHATPVLTLFRAILVQDKQQIGDTAPAITDVLEANSTMSFYNAATTERFKVLYDHTFTLDQVQNKTKFVKIYKSFKGNNNHIRYNGTASTDIQKNGVYLMLLSSEATNTPSIIYNTRFAYHDN